LSAPLHQETPTRDPGTVELIEAALADLNRIILGKDRQLRLSLACLLARGHLLIEDIPGVGKTTLAHHLARTLGLAYQRIQFTSDMLPGHHRRHRCSSPTTVSSAFIGGRVLSWSSRTRSIERIRRGARCSRRWRSTRPADLPTPTR
jgi:hypothetical protein